MSLLETARDLLAQGPICDACLGRPFADRSWGLTNRDRGHALRVSVALADDTPFEADEEDEPALARESECWVCEGECDRFEEWANLVANELSAIEFDTYQIGTKVSPLLEENGRLLREDAGLDPDAGEPLNREFNREVGKRVGQKLGVTVDFDRPDVVALLDLATDGIEIQINPAFVYGRYRKLKRGIPQTEWPCRECNGTGIQDGVQCDHCGGSGYMYEESVEELVAPPIEAAMEGTDATFHGAGREDVDALMLGTGRPFVVEVKTPRRRRPDVETLESEINEVAADKVEVTDLALATYEMVERVKELDAEKTYRAEVEFETAVASADFETALAELDGATIEQDTPDRVVHRRAKKTRTRTVYAIDGELEDDHHASIEIRGEGGLYIKELIHGDEGRTQPNLADLLDTTATVTALDVIAVESEDEPFATAEFLKESA
ncbi:MAG: tRNA pseudouridine(54/55) synthase Pus10 [Halobacteriales archaeon]